MELIATTDQHLAKLYRADIFDAKFWLMVALEQLPGPSVTPA